MLSISAVAIAEKNKIASTGAWLILFEINFMDEDPIRLVYNTEDITWPSSGGNLYQSFPFDIKEITEDGQGGLPIFSLNVSNVTRALTPYLEQSDGGIGAQVTLRVVHSEHLDLTTPELEETFENLGSTVTDQWVMFRLGTENPTLHRSPKDRYLKDHCPYKEFKGPECGYAGAAASCNRTFAQCKDYGNGSRFGGAPGIGGGVYV